MAKDLKFKLVLDADVKDFVSNTKQSKEAVAAMFDEIRKQSQDAGQATQAASDGIDKVGSEAQESAKDVEKLASDLDSANKELKETDQSSDKAKVSLSNLKQAVGILGAALAAIGLGMTAKEFIGLSDATQQMNARLRNATEGVEEYNLVQSRMLELANATFRPLEEAQEVYLNTSGAMKALGYSTSEILDATDSLSLAFTHNATSSDLAQSAQDALTKSMVKGRVDADAWSTIMRATPNIAEDLAKQTGKTTAEILKLGASGSISVRELTDALIATRGANLDLANAMENSTADAITVVKNGIRNLISELNEQHNVSARLAQTIQDIGGNLTWLVPIFDDVMSAVDALSAEFDSIDPSVFEALKQAVSAAYDAVKQLIVSGADLGKVITDVVIDSINNALAVLSSFAGETTKAGEQVSFLTRVGQGLSVTFGAISDIAYGLQVTLNLLTGVFYHLGGGISELTGRLLSLNPLMKETSKQYIANGEAMKEKAKEYYAEADKLAMNFESQTIKRLDQAIENEEQKNARILAEKRKTLDDLLALEEEEGENNEKLQSRKLRAVENFAKDAVQANDGILDSTLELELAAQGYYATVDKDGRVVVTRLTEQEQATAAATLATKKQETAFIQASESGRDFGIDVEISLNKISTGFTDNIGKLTTFANQLQDAGVVGKQAGDMVYQAWLKVLSEAKNTAEIDVAKNKLMELGVAGQVSGDQINAGFKLADAAAKDLNPALNAAREAGKALGIDIDKSTNIMSQGFAKGSGDIDTLKQKLDEAGITGKDAANTLYKGWEAWLTKADSKVELDTAQAKLEEMARQGVISTKQLEVGMDAVKVKTQEVGMTADGTAEAFKRLGIQTQEQLALAAKQAIADFEKLKASGQATAEGVQQAYKKMFAAVEASGDAGLMAMAESKAAAAGLAVQTDETGKTTVRSMEEAEAATQKVAKAAGYDAVKGFKDMGDAAKDAGEKARESSKQTESDFRADMKAMGDGLAKLAAKYRGMTDDYKNQMIALGASAKEVTIEAEKMYEALWKQTFFYTSQKDAVQAMQDNIKGMKSVKEATERQIEANERWNAKVAETSALINDAMAASAAFQGKISSIQDEYMKATGQESKMLEMRYRQRKQQLTLEYEMLKVQIATAKVAAEAAKLDTKPLEKALADATAGYAEAQRQLVELEKMEKAKLEADKKLEDAKKTTDTTKPDATKPTPKPTDTLPKPPQVNINPPTVDLDAPQKTVKYELNLNGQSVEVFGDPSQESLINAFMDDLERYKRGM